MPSGALWLQAVATAALALLTGALIGINVQYLEEMERMAAFQRGQQQPYVDYVDLELVASEGDTDTDRSDAQGQTLSSGRAALAVTNLSDSPVIVRELLVRVVPLERRRVRVNDLERTPWMPVAWEGRDPPGGARTEPISLAPQSQTRVDDVPGLAEFGPFWEALQARSRSDGLERRVWLTVELRVEENAPSAADGSADPRRFTFDFVGDGRRLTAFRPIEPADAGLDYLLDYETRRTSIAGVELAEATVTPQFGGTLRLTGETDRSETIEELERLVPDGTYDATIGAARSDGTPLDLSGSAVLRSCELSPLEASDRTQYLCELERRDGPAGS